MSPYICRHCGSQKAADGICDACMIAPQAFFIDDSELSKSAPPGYSGYSEEDPQKYQKQVAAWFDDQKANHGLLDVKVGPLKLTLETTVESACKNFMESLTAPIVKDKELLGSFNHIGGGCSSEIRGQFYCAKHGIKSEKKCKKLGLS